MSNENGGTAFPYSGVHKGEKVNQIIDSHGMTLRDFFAAQAMQGELASGGASNYLDNIASRSYAIADAMLRARGQ